MRCTGLRRPAKACKSLQEQPVYDRLPTSSTEAVVRRKGLTGLAAEAPGFPPWRKSQVRCREFQEHREVMCLQPSEFGKIKLGFGLQTFLHGLVPARVCAWQERCMKERELQPRRVRPGTGFRGDRAEPRAAI